MLFPFPFHWPNWRRFGLCAKSSTKRPREDRNLEQRKRPPIGLLFESGIAPVCKTKRLLNQFPRPRQFYEKRPPESDEPAITQKKSSLSTVAHSSPSSFGSHTPRPLTSHCARAGPHRCPRSVLPRRAIDRHATSYSHGARTLDDRCGARAENVAPGVVFVASHHSSRVAGGENSLVVRRGWRGGCGWRAAAVD